MKRPGTVQHSPKLIARDIDRLIGHAAGDALHVEGKFGYLVAINDLLGHLPMRSPENFLGKYVAFTCAADKLMARHRVAKPRSRGPRRERSTRSAHRKLTAPQVRRRPYSRSSTFTTLSPPLLFLATRHCALLGLPAVGATQPNSSLAAIAVFRI